MNRLPTNQRYCSLKERFKRYEKLISGPGYLSFLMTNYKNGKNFTIFKSRILSLAGRTPYDVIDVWRTYNCLTKIFLFSIIKMKPERAFLNHEK